MLRSFVDSTAAATDKITGLEVTCGMLSGSAWTNIEIFVAASANTLSGSAWCKPSGEAKPVHELKFCSPKVPLY